MAVAAAAAAAKHGQRTAKVSSPLEDSPAPAPPPPPSSRTRLHSFSFPTLSWGTHRLLRCSKNPDSSPPPEAADTRDKEKVHRSTGGGGGSPQRPPQRPWNLRTRLSATTAPGPAISDDADEAAAERGLPPPTAAKKRGFYIVLSKEEISRDIAAIRVTRRPKKRSRAVQRQLDLLYPGLCLADVTPDSYKIEEG